MAILEAMESLERVGIDVVVLKERMASTWSDEPPKSRTCIHLYTHQPASVHHSHQADIGIVQFSCKRFGVGAKP